MKTVSFSEKKENIFKAIILCKNLSRNPKKTSSNPYFKSRYADLSEVLDCLSEPLEMSKLAISQHPSVNGSVLNIETLVIHESGEWMSSVISCEINKVQNKNGQIETDPQKIGSLISYLRRYSIASIFCLAQEDDDAESINNRNTQENFHGKFNKQDEKTQQLKTNEEKRVIPLEYNDSIPIENRTIPIELLNIIKMPELINKKIVELHEVLKVTIKSKIQELSSKSKSEHNKIIMNNIIRDLNSLLDKEDKIPDFN
ncbi:ERF family protein [uncultured Flavobacterium sp.]|jgi:hypothetical protein|uniref:ERF family protein n=1 Tax=uncultured Flavobacterium sp. TaxID=165435 RepID=UPI00259AA0A1|nr:ERF family protein [uncultured Flavobacterium sp.]